MTTDDVDKMSVEQVRDALAVAAGYEPFYVMPGAGTWRRPAEQDVDGNDVVRLIGPHPFPATLDAAAEAMREGWEISMVLYAKPVQSGLGTVEASAFHYESNTLCPTVWGNDEIEVRFRLALKCRIAMGDSQ